MSDTHERVQRGNQAQAELSITRQAFAAVRQSILEAIATSPLSAQDDRERLYLSIGLLEKVQSLLTDCVNDGVLALNEVDVATHLRDQAEGRQVN